MVTELYSMIVNVIVGPQLTQKRKIWALVWGSLVLDYQIYLQ